MLLIFENFPIQLKEVARATPFLYSAIGSDNRRYALTATKFRLSKSVESNKRNYDLTSVANRERNEKDFIRLHSPYLTLPSF